MAQHDYVIANQGFPAFRADLNSALAAIVSNNSGSSVPSTTYAYQLWYDTGNNQWKMRNADNDAFITLATFNQTNDTVNFLDSTISTPLEVTGSSSAGAEIRLPEDTDNGAHYVALKAADSIGSNVTFTLPSADGSNGQVIRTDGSGNLSFVTTSAGVTLDEVTSLAIALG
tara:strand:- start:439 stop:951 length:513 start_codon:yes stop_codon:yes gene_type:complete